LNYLLTGPPRSGKTTIIKEIIKSLGKSAGGFYTEEIRKEGVRVGFRLKTLSGKEGIFSHIDFKSKYKVGKYGVNIDTLDKIGSQEIELALAQKKVIIVDEIGKMELFSARFKDLVWKALDSKKPVIGTIIFVKHPFADKVKNRKDVKIINLGKISGAEAVDFILNELK
jgi:nucleoside-triphosphatase